jgi:hypothetical protein
MNVYLKQFDMYFHGYVCFFEFFFFLAIFTIITSYPLQVLNSSGLKMDVEVPVD